MQSKWKFRNSEKTIKIRSIYLPLKNNVKERAESRPSFLAFSESLNFISDLDKFCAAKASSGFKKDRKTIVTAGYEGGKLQISFL